MNKLKETTITALMYLELIVMSLIVLIPIIWIVMSSLGEGNTLATSTLFPSHLTLEHYKDLFMETKYANWFFNTLIVAVINTIISVSLIMISAWILSRFNFRGKKTGLMTVLILSMFPSFLTMTAIYTLFLTFGLLDKPIALVIIYSAGAIPFNLWLVKGYLDGIPKSVDEAAYIDGSTRFNTFFKITLPLSMPIMTYVGITQFMMPWMDYILPNMLLSKEANKTLAVGLYSMISGKENSNFTMFAAGAVLVSIPITILYFIFQKYIVQGIAAGANKE